MSFLIICLYFFSTLVSVGRFAACLVFLSFLVSSGRLAACLSFLCYFVSLILSMRAFRSCYLIGFTCATFFSSYGLATTFLVFSLLFEEEEEDEEEEDEDDDDELDFGII